MFSSMSWCSGQHSLTAHRNRIAIPIGIVVTLVTTAGAIVATPAVYGQSTPNYTLFAAAQLPSDQQPVRRITLTLHNTSISVALHQVVAQAGLALGWSRATVPLTGKVSLTLRDVSVEEALAAILRGTGAVATFSEDGQTIFVRRADRAAAETQRRATGAVVGTVRDSATGKALGGATISIAGTHLSVATSDSGLFAINNAPTGTQQLVVKLFGYRSVSRIITITDGGRVTVHIVLAPVPTVLSGVLTTVTGQQRKIEIANDIGVINVDSIVRTEAIRNVSDLLASRLPGIEVTRASGAVGAPSRIRIRGINSIHASNDPVIFLNGIRVSGGAGGDTLHPATTFRLDDIDPHSIETIEVVRGPSAATLYGTDAANGVIIITTKRGREGTTRWNVHADYGWTSVPGDWPLVYQGWGHTVDNPGGAGACSLDDVAAYRCVQDSATGFNPRNDPNMTDVGRGRIGTYGASLSGGSTSMQYFLSGTYSDQLGTAKMPNVVATMIKDVRGGVPIPGWIEHPNAMQQLQGTTQLTLQPSQTLNLGLTSMVSHLDNVNGGGYIPQLGGPVLDTADAEQLFSMAVRLSEVVTHGAVAMNTDWRPQPWLTLTATGGVDESQRTDDALADSKLCLISCATDPSHRVITRAEDLVYSASWSGTFSRTFNRLFSMRTSVGAQYNRNTSNATTVVGIQLGWGSTSINSAVRQTASQFENVSATGGWYLEEMFSVSGRVFLTGALREDRGSSFGAAVRSVPYPKVGLSWLVSDHASHRIRLRTAYGVSGVQPRRLDALATYTIGQTVLNGQLVQTALVNTSGNTNLEPEKSAEWEEGIDLGILNDRIAIEGTLYQKRNRAAIIDRSLAPSLGLANPMRLENVGEVMNRGLEFSVSATLIDRPDLTWNLSVGATHNTNKLVSLGVHTTPFSNYDIGRIVAGYPLDGVWRRPVLAASDINGNGILEANEIVIGDTTVFQGYGQPKYTANYRTTVSLFNRHLQLGASFAYSNTLTVAQQGVVGDRGLQDAHAPLAEQALSAVSFAGGGTRTQTVSILRFNSLSITCDVPRDLAKLMGGVPLAISVFGNNLGLWTRYLGKDPEGTSSVRSEVNIKNEAVVLPQTRNWTISVRVGY